jgi:REP element-mobilizing transposase RayT
VKYDPAIHHRHSIRLPEYDYSAAGYYYVTICTHNRETILDLPGVGRVVHDAWHGLPGRFAGIGLDEFIAMPNHVHGIVIFRDGAAGFTLGDVLRAFKSVSAIEANRHLGRSGRPLWQRNYFERVIRNERELEAVRQYIRDNPLNWDVDPQNPAGRRTA